MSYDSSMIHLGDLRSIYFCLGMLSDIIMGLNEVYLNF